MIDVGQGNCTVIAKDEKAVVLDCGGDYKNHLLNELRYSNIKKIELLALTHLDFDHTNFLELILDTYSVDKIVIPDFADKEKLADALVYADKQCTEIEYISKDCEFDVLDGSRIKAYVELAYKSKIDSNTSALYMFECHNTSICFTGDMDINQEYVYLDYGSSLDCDVLSVSHHGSAYSSYDKILKLYSPDYSVISVSKNNIYGLPDKRIVSRLSEYSTVLTTAQKSTIIFKIYEKGYELIN
jgi:beta-lactamase superfamily II metal-dependent hydrolase